MFSRLLGQHPFCCPSVRDTLIFKSYDLRNTRHEAIPALDSDSSGRFWQSKLNTSGKDSAFETPRRTFMTHGKRPKYEHSREFERNWFQFSRVILRALSSFSGEEGTADAVETENQHCSLKMGLKCYNLTVHFMDKELLLVGEQVGLFLGWN